MRKSATVADFDRRTNEDKRRAVMTLLNDAEWATWSDREIARRAGVHHDLVGTLRKSLAETASEPRTYTTRHGTVATMNTAHITAAGEAGGHHRNPTPCFLSHAGRYSRNRPRHRKF